MTQGQSLRRFFPSRKEDRSRQVVVGAVVTGEVVGEGVAGMGASVGEDVTGDTGDGVGATGATVGEELMGADVGDDVPDTGDAVGVEEFTSHVCCKSFRLLCPDSVAFCHATANAS